jgi:hypothetical protein
MTRMQATRPSITEVPSDSAVFVVKHEGNKIRLLRP